MTFSALFRCSILSAASFCVAVLLAGCSDEPQIRSYSVDKEPVPATTQTADAKVNAPKGAPADRMIGAIVPAGERTWYFKAVGPIASMDKNAGAISEFFQSIRVDPQAQKPEWKLPAGWQEQPASGMRIATLMIPTETKPLEMTVIVLPSSGAPNELLDNVNRWRGQLQLPPLDSQSLATSIKEIKVGDATATVVDERGHFSAGSMTPPFAGGGPFSGGQPPARPSATPPATTGSADLPPGHPPIEDVTPPTPAAAGPLAFKAPESWQSQPASGFRKAAFTVADGGKSAEVTVIDLSASAPNVAEPLSNINRWRGEVGLAPVTQADVPAMVQKIEVGGHTSDYVELIPDATKPEESKADKATVAVIVPAGDTVWFFKMRGDRELVMNQRDNFKSFLESVRFKSADGAGDGNNQ